MSDEKTMLTLTVTTTDGRATKHVYSLPNDPKSEESKKAIESILGPVREALGGKSLTTLLHNPLVAYHKDHIVSVAMDFDLPGTQALEDAQGQVERYMGFRRPSERRGF